MTVVFRHGPIQTVVDGLPCIGLRVENQLVVLVNLRGVILLDGDEGAINASLVGSRVTIIFPSVSSSEQGLRVTPIFYSFFGYLPKKYSHSFSKYLLKNGSEMYSSVKYSL